MFTFKKDEKLSSRKVIQELYESGNAFNSKCFRLVWKKDEGVLKFPAQVLITVPKKNFKLAVERNRIKRRIREAYRKNKSPLYVTLNTNNKKIVFALGYMAKEELSYAELESKLIITLHRLISDIEKDT